MRGENRFPMSDPTAIDRIHGGLIVSCQAANDSPLSERRMIAALVQCAEIGGAAGVRVEGEQNIAFVRDITALPIIGIEKVERAGTRLITPHLEAVPRLTQAGADIVAIELTHRAYPAIDAYARALQQVDPIRTQVGVPLMADISTAEEAAAAHEAGCDLVATTLAGYTSYSRTDRLPDTRLVSELLEMGLTVVAEGGYQDPGQVRQIVQNGAWSVCVGTAITDPIAITRRFVEALEH